MDNRLHIVIENIGEKLIKEIQLKQSKQSFYNYLMNLTAFKIKNGEFDSILQNRNYNTNKNLSWAVIEELGIMTTSALSKLKTSSDLISQNVLYSIAILYELDMNEKNQLFILWEDSHTNYIVHNFIFENKKLILNEIKNFLGEVEKEQINNYLNMIIEYVVQVKGYQIKKLKSND